jgi:hypothetical protein
MKSSSFTMKELFFLYILQFEMEHDHPDAGPEVKRGKGYKQIAEEPPACLIYILDGEIGE